MVFIPTTVQWVRQGRIQNPPRILVTTMHALRTIADLAGPAERALCGGRGCWWAGSMSGAAQDWAQQETMTASHAIHGIRQGAGGATATFV